MLKTPQAILILGSEMSQEHFVKTYVYSPSLGGRRALVETHSLKEQGGIEMFTQSSCFDQQSSITSRARCSNS